MEIVKNQVEKARMLNPDPNIDKKIYIGTCGILGTSLRCFR